MNKMNKLYRYFKLKKDEKYCKKCGFTGLKKVTGKKELFFCENCGSKSRYRRK